MKRKSLIVLVLALFISMFKVPVNAATIKFNDVKENNAHYNGVHTLANDKIINGYPKNLYKPNDTISRGQAATLFTRAKKLPIPNNINAVLKNYKDVSTKHSHKEGIAAAYNAGIFTGSNGNFNDGALSREQMATVIVRAYNLKDNGKKVNANLSNIDPSHRNNVKILVQHGITNQTGDFRPRQKVTRGQFATFLYRTMQTVEKKYQEMDVTFLDVGQGDSTFIQTINGKNILIDAGTQSAGQRVVSYLKEKDVGKLDLVIATHPHADHIGGLIPVLNNFKVDKFVDSGQVHTSKTYEDLLNLIDNKNIPFEIPNVGKKYKYDDFEMTVIHVDSGARNVNNASVSVKGVYDKVSFMLTGDAEKEAENTMVNSNFNLKSTVYKAGHHGSNTSSTPAFLNKVRPEATILSYGKNNSYGHPNSDVINRLRALGSDIYSTADSGNIEVMSNGVIYNVSAKAMQQPSKPTPKPDPKPEPKPDPEPEVKFPLNINKATADQLKELPGIGETLAPRIVEYRKKHGPFKKKTDIMNVKGIGQGRYDNIKDLIVV